MLRTFTWKVVYQKSAESQEKIGVRSWGGSTEARICSNSGGPDTDDGEEGAALGAFFAVAEQKVAAAGGAEIAGEDVGGAEASVEGLGAVGLAAVEAGVPER